MRNTTALLISLSLLSGCGKNVSNDETQAPLAGTQKTQNKAETKVFIEKGSSENIAMVLVPEGEFIRGSNKTDTEGLKEQYGFTTPLYVDEHPQHKSKLKAFYIDTYEVSNTQYKEFTVKTQRQMPPPWFTDGYALTMKEAATMEEQLFRKIATEHFKLDMDTRTMTREAIIVEMEKIQKGMDNFPVTGITWQDADEYCKWRGQRLPTEAEWEKAARGPNGSEFPWGNNWVIGKTETGDDSEFEEGFAPVGSYPENKSPYGAYDLGGNVWEWTASWYEAYPGADYNSPDYGQKKKVIRGGGGGVGHYALSYFFRGATRQFAEPDIAGEDVGFRCAKDI